MPLTVSQRRIAALIALVLTIGILVMIALLPIDTFLTVFAYIFLISIGLSILAYIYSIIAGVRGIKK